MHIGGDSPLARQDIRSSASRAVQREKMNDPDEAHLGELSVEEVAALKARIHEAVRAIIRERNQAMARPAATPVDPAAKAIDLGVGREEWLAARRGPPVSRRGRR